MYLVNLKNSDNLISYFSSTHSTSLHYYNFITSLLPLTHSSPYWGEDKGEGAKIIATINTTATLLSFRPKGEIYELA